MMVEKLKGKAARNAFRHWKACIHSGITVRITIVEGHPVSMGFCRHKLKNRYIDFEIECPSCKKHKRIRTPPKHERTATRRARIGTARRRSIAKSKEHFERFWKRPTPEKH